MRLAAMNIVAISLSSVRPGVAFASRNARFGARSPTTSRGARFSSRSSSKWLSSSSRPALLATLPTRPASSSSSLGASLRDLLEQSSDPPSPATVAAPLAAQIPAEDVSTTASDVEEDVAEEEPKGGMMKGPPGATSVSSEVDGDSTSTSTSTPTSTSTEADPTPTKSYTEPMISISDAYDSGNGEFVSLRFAASTSTPTSTSTQADPTPTKSYTEPMISISDAYDSGNGEFVSLRFADGEDDYCDVHVHVKIKPDPFTQLEHKQHFQYFSFRSTLNPDSPAMRGLFHGKKSIKVKYVVDNAGYASYAAAFQGYSTFFTTRATPFDPDSWRRKDDTSVVGKSLTWTHTHEVDGDASAYFAYFPPYSQDRHLDLISKCAMAEGATVKSLGPTIEGREIDYVTVGNGPNNCWIIHRQHPGESMAEFYAEGLLTRLLGLDDKWDKVAERARELYTFRIVPNINPDGSCNGYLRTNADGQNLNREWCPSPAPLAEGSEDDAEPETYEAPTMERSPEVYHLLRRMDETGCDAFLDIHGDEALPFNFLAGSQGMPVWGKRLESLHGMFLASYERANPDMQAKVSYEPDEPGGGMPNICSNQIAQRFDCFSGTLEMPFKECWADVMRGTGGGEDGEDVGWGPERARRLGASVLDALCYIAPHLRDDGEFWSGLP
eukprot:CAMPEP_0183744004 /NCGR_PEP_ID=MMETSP0737-20130205/65510_1 /TAXON_ID=385413 /ORGANISM="Thalassiosira miniscula, Strain CCMP1093" /LENGTH=666 /DNA_ID=CAMNT_0025979639 /DNA_START=256 /DNA_END=2252 /DNA_ORIENTATION=-